MALALLWPIVGGKPVRGNPGLEVSALQVVAAERGDPGLDGALGNARLSVVQVGDLTAGRRRLGATMLVDLAVPRRDVRATVPAYVPSTGRAGATYTLQGVRMHVAVLRDALIDVDLDSRRVIAIEPGPRSESVSWSESKAPAPAGAEDED